MEATATASACWRQVSWRSAFSAEGLGCARCHGMKAQGLRGPPLGGGVELEDFRNLQGAGLFPPAVVTDRDFEAVNAWLRTLPKRPPGPPS